MFPQLPAWEYIGSGQVTFTSGPCIQGHMGHSRVSRILGSGEQTPRLAPLCLVVGSGPCVSGCVICECVCLCVSSGFDVCLSVGFTAQQGTWDRWSPRPYRAKL